MRCKLFLLSTLVCSSAIAQTWEEKLKSDLELANQAFQAKIEQCRTTRIESPTKITDDWFMKLTKGEKAAAISYLSHMAYDRCSQREEANYSKALVAYAIEVKDLKLVEAYGKLRTIYKPTGTEEFYSRIDIKQLEKLSQSTEFYYPFNELNLLEQY